MKKQLALCLLLLASLLLAACGASPSGPPATQAPANTPAATTAAETAPDATLPPAVVVSDGGDTSGDGGDGAVSTAPELAPWSADAFGYGVQIHGDATYGDPVYTADVVKHRLGLDWVKVQIRWSAVHPEPDTDQWFIYDGTIDELSKQGLYIMVSVVSAPQWTRSTVGEEGPPDDYGQYVAFLNELLARHGGQIQAVEVWNEQNIIREWNAPNGLSAADYVSFLQGAHGAIKAYNPNIIVISGALSPTGVHNENSRDDFIFLDEMLAAGLLNYADCVGVHHNGYNIPPNVAFDQTGAVPEAGTASFRGPFDNVHHSWSFFTTLETYAQKVQAVDPAKKLCVTEFGWASSENYDAIPETFEYAWDNTLAEQADYIVQAYQQMHSSGYVWLTFLFNFDFGNKGFGVTDDTVPYSIVNFPDGTPRPAFDAVANMVKVR